MQRFRLAHLLVLMTGVALLLVVWRLLDWGITRAVMYGPGVACLLGGAAGAFWGKGRRAEWLAVALGAMLSLASPHFLAWYTWHVVGDHTANIGAGMLWIAQPVLAPGAAFLGWLSMAGVKSRVRGDAGAPPRDEGSEPPLP